MSFRTDTIVFSFLFWFSFLSSDEESGKSFFFLSYGRIKEKRLLGHELLSFFFVIVPMKAIFSCPSIRKKKGNLRRWKTKKHDRVLRHSWSFLVFTGERRFLFLCRILSLSVLMAFSINRSAIKCTLKEDKNGHRNILLTECHSFSFFY